MYCVRLCGCGTGVSRVGKQALMAVFEPAKGEGIRANVGVRRMDCFGS